MTTGSGGAYVVVGKVMVDGSIIKVVACPVAGTPTSRGIIVTKVRVDGKVEPLQGNDDGSATIGIQW
jgi:hypothetical protein